MKRSAGLLLWRRTPDGSAVEVLLAHPGGPLFVKKDDGHWSIPKGECDPGEDEWAAAQREFSEELGIPVPDGTPVSLGELKQNSGKVNVVWALEGDPGPFELVSNLFEMEWPPAFGKTWSIPGDGPRRMVLAVRRAEQALRVPEAVHRPARGGHCRQIA